MTEKNDPDAFRKMNVYLINEGEPLANFAFVMNCLLLFCIVFVTSFAYWIGLYIPILMFYQFYPIIWSLASYFQEAMYPYPNGNFIYSEIIFSFIGFSWMIICLIEYFNGSTMDDKFEGTITYPQTVGNLLSIRNYNQRPQWFYDIFTFYGIVLFMSLGFSFCKICIGIFMTSRFNLRKEAHALKPPKYNPLPDKELPQISDKELHQISEKDIPNSTPIYPSYLTPGCGGKGTKIENIDKWRFVASIIALVVFIIGLAQMCLGFSFVMMGVIPISLFPNPFCLLYFCIFIAINPPPPVCPYKNNLWSVNENLNRRPVGGAVPSKWFKAYMGLFAISILIGGVNIIMLIQWRQDNSITPAICNGNIAPFTAIITSAIPLNYTNDEEMVTYIKGPHTNVNLFGTYTCLDDILLFVQLSLSIVIFILHCTLHNGYKEEKVAEKKEGNREPTTGLTKFKNDIDYL